jgi:hypothetical protein
MARTQRGEPDSFASSSLFLSVSSLSNSAPIYFIHSSLEIFPFFVGVHQEQQLSDIVLAKCKLIRPLACFMLTYERPTLTAMPPERMCAAQLSSAGYPRGKLGLKQPRGYWSADI